MHFDYKPPRTEDDEGVWASAAACMRNYLILRAKARGVPGRPGGPGGAGARRGSPELAEPTLAAGETWRDVREVVVDADELGARGMGYEHLDQLATRAPVRRPLTLFTGFTCLYWPVEPGRAMRSA